MGQGPQPGTLRCEHGAPRPRCAQAPEKSREGSWGPPARSQDPEVTNPHWRRKGGLPSSEGAGRWGDPSGSTRDRRAEAGRLPGGGSWAPAPEREGLPAGLRAGQLARTCLHPSPPTTGRLQGGAARSEPLPSPGRQEALLP